MAPQRPRSKPSSGSAPPSPTKSSPRKSTDRRRSVDPTKRTSRDVEGASPTKRGSRDVNGTPKRTSRDAEAGGASKRTSRNIDGGSPTKDDARERRRRSTSSPTKGTPKRTSGSPKKSTPKPAVAEKESSSQGSLSADSLAKLDAYHAKEGAKAHKQDKEKVVTGRVVKDRGKKRRPGSGGGAALATGSGAALLTEKNLQARTGADRTPRKAKMRAAAASVLEAGSNLGKNVRRPRGGGKNHMSRPANTSRRKKFLCLGALFIGVMLLILVPVGVLVVGKQSNGGDPATATAGPNNGNLGGISPDSIPQWAKGGPLDPFSWYDTQDFNVTFTNASVGGLPIMGLNSTWDDSAKANGNVPPLNQPFGYGTRPIRGVNLGGWLAIEPFITPSMFNQYGSKDNVVDEYTLCQTLGSSSAKATLEAHYSSFINAQAFADVRAAGFDHVRIPYSYWAVTTYPGDPYVPKVAWRYLLRGIEYARQNGIRVNLDLHGLPGSQNGWNHSGRQGTIGWLNGTDGALNGQRSLDLHQQLSTFFAQPRYANVVGIYGLVNEPKMISLPSDVVFNWTSNAIDIVRASGMQQWIAVGDGFLGLPKWQGQLSGDKNVVLDAHQYVIFNTDQIAMDHTNKLTFACAGWQGQMEMSTNPSTGFGPTLCGEWSQADTDCTQFINNVNVGARWTGTMNLDDPSLNVLSPDCPLKNSQCSCDAANADPSTYSAAYKQWLRSNAEAQMESFEIGLGWFYWTWLTESATQWSWKLGIEAGILPTKVWEREFSCNNSIPDFAGMGLSESF